MFVIYLTALSILIQLSAAYLSLRLIYITRKQYSWVFIALALLLQASRRGYTLYELMSGTIPSSQVAYSEYIGLVISVLMLTGVIGIASFLRKSERSIVLQKKAEEKFRESENKFNKLYENGPFGMVIVNKELIFKSSNPAFAQMLGYSQEELRNFTFLDITHPDDIEENLLNIRKLINKEISVYKTEKRFLKNDGQIIWVSLTVTSNYSKEGKFLYNLAIIEDITSRKNNEEALRKSEALLNEMGTIAHIGGWEFSPVTGKASWTKEVAHIHDINTDMLITVLAGINYYHEDSRPVIEKAVNDAVEFAKPYDLELEIVSAKGIRKWIRTIGHPVIENGVVVKVHGSFQDITEFKNNEIALRETDEKLRILNDTLEQKVNERTAQLVEANQELEAFSYSVSHDLRAPLRHISGFVDLLNSKYHEFLPETGKHYLKVIYDSAQRMGLLIDDLLQFSRTGRQEMHQSNLDMNMVVNEVLELIREDLKDRKVEWTIARLPLIAGDQSLLRIAWYNLLSNAVKFTRDRETARIEIGYKVEDAANLFFVKDNGAGFDMRYAQKLFGVFQRLHTQKEFEGTGIGLANVRRIILRHGGQTWAESQVGQGATFYFTLPKSEVTNGTV